MRQPFGKNEKEEALWVFLYGQHPARYWDELILDSEIANRAYGWVIFGLILWSSGIVVFPFATGTSAQMVSEQFRAISLISILSTLYAALKQDRLLPFIRSSRFVHYLATMLLAVPGIMGILVWLIFRQHTMNAKGNLSAMRNAIALDPGIAGITKEKLEAEDCLVDDPAGISVGFAKWCADLAELFRQKKSRYGIEAIRRSSLLNAFESNQTPEDFWATAYRYKLPEVLHEKVLLYNSVIKSGKLSGQNGLKVQPVSLSAKPDAKDGPIVKKVDPIEEDSFVPSAGFESAEVSTLKDPQHDLQKLFNLYRNGHISEEEFKSLKEKL